MPSMTVGVAAATAVVGYDLLNDIRQAQSPNDRALTGVGLTGSAVIGDCEIELLVDDVTIGHYFNSALLTPQVDRDIISLEDLGWASGARLQAVVIDAPATSILYLVYLWEDL